MTTAQSPSGLRATSLELSLVTSSPVRKPTAPFLKWPGGKRWAAPLIADLIRGTLRGVYYEPFLGGGAVFFQLRPRLAVLSDINKDLIATYCTVRRAPHRVLAEVRRIPVSKREYYRIRQTRVNDPILRAAHFLYLNRTGFAGIYRLTRDGQFNVPYGGGQRTPSPLWTNGLLESAAQALAGAQLKTGDFEHLMNGAGPGDVIYCDPTYTVTHDQNGFVRYNERNFSWADQQRLAAAANRAARGGATVLVSNAHHHAVGTLYKGVERLTLARTSRVSARVVGRRSVKEYLFVLRPPQ